MWKGKTLLALILALGLCHPASAAVSVLRGASIAITAATNATPIVLTTAANTLVANDWVFVSGVQGNPTANGLFQCSAVTATTCTLTGSAGSGAYTAGGGLLPLSVAATSTGLWYDVSQADRCFVQVWSVAASVATVVIEQSSSPTANIATDANRASPATPAFVAATITNPSATGELWSVPCTGTVRVRVSAWTSGNILGTLEAYRGNARIW